MPLGTAFGTCFPCPQLSPAAGVALAWLVPPLVELGSALP